jgi:hypothetical protein
MEPQFVRLDAVRAFELAAGVTGQPLFGEGSLVLDVFRPVREDYRDRWEAKAQ